MSLITDFTEDTYPTLPPEIIDEVIDHVCAEQKSRRQMVTVFSALALTCATFRYRINRIRFRNIAFVFKSSVFPRPGIRMTEFGSLLSADKSVWGRRSSSGMINNTIAHHITHFSIDIKAGLPYVLYLLADGVLAKIMRKLFRGDLAQSMHESGQQPDHKFTLSLDVLSVGGLGDLTLIDWNMLSKEFSDAFSFMCSTSQISTLSVRGVRRFPSQIICDSNIKQLHLTSVSFDPSPGSSSVSKYPRHLRSLIMNGLPFGIPDDNVLLHLTSFTALLLDFSQLQTLLDIVDGTLELEELRICFELNEIPQTHENIELNLPHLKRLAVDIDTLKIGQKRSMILPLEFILGPHFPPSVEELEIALSLYIPAHPRRDDHVVESLQEALGYYNLPLLGVQLAATADRAPRLERIVFRVSVKHLTFIGMDPSMKKQTERDLKGIISSLLSFPSTSAVSLNIQVVLDENQDLWRRTQHTYYR